MSEQLEAPTAGAPSPSPKSQTFLAVAVRSYWRSVRNRVATVWVASIIFLTVFVPFIANEAPYTAVIDGRREWPLFRDLTRVDWIWLVWGVALLAWTICYQLMKRRPQATDRSRSRNSKLVLAIGGIAVLLSLSIALFKSNYLDVRDYHRMARGGGGGGAGMLQDAVFPPLRWGFAEQEPLEAGMLYQRPTWAMDQAARTDSWHWLGTDGNGRDVLARLLWGARVVLEIGLVSEIIALFIGVIYGSIMGYFVGKVDIIGMRFVEVIEAIPLLFLLITFVAIFGRQLFIIMVIIGVTGWTGIARFVRAEFLRIRSMDYVSAARALGLPLRNILFRHMLPNGLTPVIVAITFGVAGNIVSESILSFLGIGVEPPTASWGAMLNEAGNPGEVFRWWLAMAPGVMIFLTVFAYNIIGEGLRDAIDPRTNKME